MTGPDSPLAAALRDRYLIERELGRGGMATVYLARDRKHDRLVALKVLHLELALTLGPERFHREIKTAARLQHPHILSVHDSGEDAGRLWFTMPYVEGESLRQKLVRQRQLPVEDAVRITREAAQALHYAHEHGVVHRDVKPENLLLTPDGNTLVADFGVAQAVGVGEERLTQTGLAVGTPAYMSPEQGSGSTELDARTDVYSLGCVLYEMLAGEPPFTGPTPQAVIAKRLSGPPLKLSLLRPTVSAALADAVERALAVSPADRFASVAEFARSLDSREVPSPPARRRPRRGLALALAGILAGIGYLGLRQTGVVGTRSLVSAGVIQRRDQLVLTEFSDRANDSSLATAITEAFRVDFARSRLVGLASADRVRQTLRLMQQPDSSRMTPALGREVALRAGFTAVLTGEVSRLGEGYMISAQLIGADSGQVLAAHRETAADAGEIIPAVDRLSEQVRRRIGESLRGVRAGPPLKTVTTGSLEALRQYSLGARLGALGRYEESLPLLERAVRLDSTFAMAWSSIATTLWNLRRDPARQVEAITRAYALRDRLTERERHATDAHYFEWALGDRGKARASWQAFLAIDSTNPAAFTNLGLLTWFEGDFPAAAELAARAIRVDSTERAPYTNLVDAQVTLGRFASAETTLARWRSRFGQDAGYEVQVGLMASARGDYDSAARAFRRGVAPGGSAGDRAAAAFWLARLATTRGRLGEARRFRHQFAELRERRSELLWSAVEESLTEVYYSLGRERAVARLDSLQTGPGFTEVDATERPYGGLALAYAIAGKPDRARSVLARAERELQQAGPNGQLLLQGHDHRMFVHAANGALLMQDREFEDAAEAFRRARSIYSGVGWLPEEALALDRAGLSDSALVLYREYLESTYNFRLIADPGNLAPVLRRVGELREARGDRAGAAAAYQRFLSLWREADPVLQPQVSEIRRRLAGLVGEPR